MQTKHKFVSPFKKQKKNPLRKEKEKETQFVSYVFEPQEQLQRQSGNRPQMSGPDSPYTFSYPTKPFKLFVLIWTPGISQSGTKLGRFGGVWRSVTSGSDNVEPPKTCFSTSCQELSAHSKQR